MNDLREGSHRVKVKLWVVLGSGQREFMSLNRLEAFMQPVSGPHGNNDGGFLDFDEAGSCPLLEFRHNLVHLFARLNELDFDGEMIGDLEDVRGMNAVPGAESRNALDHCGACDAAAKEVVENAGVDRNPVMLRSIAQVERDLNGLSGGQHRFLSARERGHVRGPGSPACQTPKD